jgi:MFS transporter, PAT family, beta-lactamase induction signal transducer AmpG
MSVAKRIRNPILWVPTSYFAEGIPYVLVNGVAATMFKDLGHSDTDIAVATASIGFAWSLKPFWAAFLDMYRTKKFFVVTMEILMSLVLAGVALALPLSNYFRIIISMLWVLAFSGATQDICVDGVYITALDKKRQAVWAGVQGMSWNVGKIFATAVVVAYAGSLQKSGYDSRTAWTRAIALSAATLMALGVYHFLVLPTGSVSHRPKDTAEVVSTFVESVKAFFQKKSIWGMLAFVFFYRTGEGFLLTEAPLFLQSSLTTGGVGLTLSQKALVDGTVSTVVSIAGGLLGGAFVSRIGLKRSLLILAICMNVPHLCYVYLSQQVSPDAPLSMVTVLTLVSIEKFGYSFGFMGNMLYMMQQLAPGKYKMTHYAFATALMNLVLQPTQMVSGLLAESVGYRRYFLLVMFASIPSIIVAWRAPFPDPPDVDDDEAPGPPVAIPEDAPAAVPTDAASAAARDDRGPDDA